MEITGRKFGEIWELDAHLATVAEELVAEFTGDLGHIDLERVVFARQRGLKGTAGDWLGKCYYVKEPYSMIPQCTLLWMKRHGLFNFEKFEEMLNSATKGAKPLHVVGADCDNERGIVTLHVIDFDENPLGSGSVGFKIPFYEYIVTHNGVVRNCQCCGQKLGGVDEKSF